MMLPIGLWSFVGLLTGLWKVIVLAGGIGFLVWQKGLHRHPAWRLLRPWVLRTVDPTATANPEPTASPSAKRPRIHPSPRVVTPPVSTGASVHPVLANWKTILVAAALLVVLAWVLFRISVSDAVVSSN